MVLLLLPDKADYAGGGVLVPEGGLGIRSEEGPHSRRHNRLRSSRGIRAVHVGRWDEQEEKMAISLGNDEQDDIHCHP